MVEINRLISHRKEILDLGVQQGVFISFCLALFPSLLYSRTTTAQVQPILAFDRITYSRSPPRDSNSLVPALILLRVFQRPGWPAPAS